MKVRWVSVVGQLIGQVLGECLVSPEHVRSDNYVCVCVCVYSLLCSSAQIAVSCLIVKVIMKYCLIYWVVESCVILMNRTFYFFIRFIVWWLGVAPVRACVFIRVCVGTHRPVRPLMKNCDHTDTEAIF